ncbi:hypothetical protein PTTG_29680, partial [Puccinia triticina 1-1 BBBD Race 1]
MVKRKEVAQGEGVSSAELKNHSENGLCRRAAPQLTHSNPFHSELQTTCTTNTTRDLNPKTLKFGGFKMDTKSQKVPAFFHSRFRNRDSRTVWRCDLCQGGEFLSVRYHALGKLHWENLRGHNEETARKLREKYEAGLEDSPSQPEVQDTYGDFSKNRETYNHQDDLDAMAATARLQELPFFTRLNIDDEISLQDLIDAELEEILCQEDAGMFDGPGHQEEEVDPAEAAKWFPFNNKMELVGSLLIGHTHSMISQAIYNKIRAAMTICDIRLPAWATVRGARIRIRKLLQTQLKTKQSPFGTPCFSLSLKGILSQVRQEIIRNWFCWCGSP